MTADEEPHKLYSSSMQTALASRISEQMVEVRQAAQGVCHHTDRSGTSCDGGSRTTYDYHRF